MRKLALAALLAAILGACATTERVWVKPGSTDREFNMDAGQCRAQAYSVPNAPPMRIAIVYASCMQGKGWHMEDQPIR